MSFQIHVPSPINVAKSGPKNLLEEMKNRRRFWVRKNLMSLCGSHVHWGASALHQTHIIGYTGNLGLFCNLLFVSMWSRMEHICKHSHRQSKRVKRFIMSGDASENMKKRKRPNVSRLMSGKRLCSIPDGKLRQRFYKLRAIYLKTLKRLNGKSWA